MKTKLRDLLFPQPKSKIKAGEGKQEGKYKFFTSSPVQNKYIDVATYMGPALIFGTGGNASVHFCNEPFSTSTDCLVMYGKNDIELQTIYFYLRNNIYLLEEGFKGAGLKHISKDYILDISVDLFSKQIQQEFLQAMTSVETIIEKRKEQLAKLDQFVKSRFIEMFGMIGIDEKGWGLTRLGNCCVVNPKKSNDNRLCVNLTVSFVPMPAVSEKGDIDPSDIKPYNEVKTGFTYFAEEDVLFAKITPCMENGKGAVAKGLFNGIGFGSTEFHVLRPLKNVSNPYWLYAVTSFEQFRIDAANNMTGSAGQRRVPASFLENYRVAVPPIELQNQFAAFVEQTDKSKLAIQQSLEQLETLKKSLMQKYFG